MSYILLKALSCDICGRPYFGRIRDLTIDGDEDECVVDHLMDIWSSAITDQRSMACHQGWRYEMEVLDVKYGPAKLGVVRCPRCFDRPHPHEVEQADPTLEHDRECYECREDPKSDPRESKCARRRFGDPAKHSCKCPYDIPY
jgi:hypothetical protein